MAGFDKRIRIGGVILNNVARARHENILTQSIARYCDVPVLGILPKSKEVEIPDRHLGLIPAGEQDMLQNRIELLGNMVSNHIDLDKLLQVACGAAPLQQDEAEKPAQKLEISSERAKVKIGVLRDKAFSFYYPENLEALEAAGGRAGVY